MVVPINWSLTVQAVMGKIWDFEPSASLWGIPRIPVIGLADVGKQDWLIRIGQARAQEETPPQDHPELG